MTAGQPLSPVGTQPRPPRTIAALLRAVLRGDKAAWKGLRRSVFEVVEIGRGDGGLSRFFDTFIIALILLNIVAFMLETIESVKVRWGTWLDGFEFVSVIIFTIEYLLRIWTSVEMPFLSKMPRWRARLHFARGPYQIIDLLAILPYYLSFLIPIDTRVLRVLRLLRFLKFSRYSPAMHALVRVFANERRSLAGAGLLLAAAVLIASTGMYYIENEAQPDKFSSVPETMYWAITTLTTVGYGDVSPVTPLGKLWAAFVMVTGLCILALPVAIIASGFAQESGRRDFVVTWSLMSRIPLLAELDTSEVAAIMPLLQATNYPPHSEVIKANSTADAMYFIASGAVELSEDDRRIRYETGDFFGALTMLEGGKNPGTYMTVSRARLLKMYREDFLRLELAHPAVCAHVRKIANERRKAREDYERDERTV